MEFIIIAVVTLVLLAGVATYVAARGRRELGAPTPKPEVTAGTAAPEAPAEVAEAAAVEAPSAPVEAPSRWRDRLTKARGALSGTIGGLLSREAIDTETWDDLEAGLLQADVGVPTTMALLDRLKDQVKAEGLTEPDQLVEALKADLKEQLGGADRSLRYDEGLPNVWLFVGVNGVGKTTTIGKLAKHQMGEGRSVILAAGDTFRAAAAEQLQHWAERAGADSVRGEEGGDPS